VVTTRPTDWEDEHLDLSGFIAATNAMKAETPTLNEEGPQRRISAPHAPYVALLREATDRNDGCVLLLINPDSHRACSIEPGPILFETGGRFSGFEDATPHASPIRLVPGQPFILDAFGMRVFRGEPVRSPRRPSDRSEKVSEKRLERLARERVVIESVWPELDGGRHPVKRVVGDVLEVWADIFSDGHEHLRACLKYRGAGDTAWTDVPMRLFDNDRWVGRIPLLRNGRTIYTIEAWRDLFETWRADLVKKRDAGLSVSLELVEGRKLVETALAANDDKALRAVLERLDWKSGGDSAMEVLLSDELSDLMGRLAPRTNLSAYHRELEVIVDRSAASYGAWYELFPRSASGVPGRHGTFDDVIARLPYVREMGFDVLYLPPIHPIGRTNRKGQNNSLEAAPDDPGSPWAIGAFEGGHTAIHRELGSFDDFERLLAAAKREGMEVALDFAIQCSPDHPWIKEHPEWFDWRPDGSIKFAENPPKKYQDIVNVHFYRGALPSLWYALRDVVLFWIDRGVRIFRVDNPHTKPVPFWEWLIGEVRDRHPDTIFLSEAFTRPKMMHKLAKIGFSQSYTYFTWRNTKAELAAYLTELTQTAAKEYFRPNFFVNTPDINPPFLQTGGRPAFRIRATLAATLSSLWGLYSGFELCEATPIPDREEYLNSEKYEIKVWDWNRPGNIRDTIASLNRIRRANPALHRNDTLRFYTAHSEQILFYGKTSAGRDNIIWVAVNLDPHNAHEATIELPLGDLHLGNDAELEVEELFSGERFRWRGRTQWIRLDPGQNPCAIWRISPPALV
jgi:starch synthase (maltosyl-transferring)